MLVVLARAQDAGARALVERWRSRGARLMAPRDLSRPGWRHHVGPGGGEDWVVADGQPLRAGAITGVLTRLPCVLPDDLPHIVDHDRHYVAAEMNALLMSWLAGLACPVLNRPAPPALMGPHLGREGWLALAVRAGARVPPGPSAAPAAEPPSAVAAGPAAPAVAVAVVGDRWFGAAAPELGRQALRLARLASVEVLTARFDGAAGDAVFVGADLTVDADSDEIAGALLARFAAGARA
jgi:hypothetical protein